jgi:hypothetical protein
MWSAYHEFDHPALYYQTAPLDDSSPTPNSQTLAATDKCIANNIRHKSEDFRKYI